jgi:hypothetical protein
MNKYGSGSRRSKKIRIPKTENNFLRGLEMVSLMTGIILIWIFTGGKL